MEEIIHGPRTSNKSFLSSHLDERIPEMKAAAELARAGKLDLAQGIFASYVRSLLKPEKLNRDWLAPYSEERLSKLKKNAESVMDYNFAPCGIHHKFEDHKVDWLSNPTYNNYCEWPWQLSRHAELNRLAEYYTKTGDEAVTDIWLDMISSWLDRAVIPVDGTPGNTTICWRTIEAGIRMEVWTHQIFAFIRSQRLTDEFITRYFASVYEHGHRLRIAHRHGNWLIIEMTGLIRIAELFTFLREADEWREYSLGKLEAELKAQVYPDGFQYELSTEYHGVVDYNYYEISKIYHDMELTPPAFLVESLEKLYNMYPRLVRPDGRLPDLNDGRQMVIKGKMQLASALYPSREDFRYFATDRREGSAPDYLSFAFPYSGAVVMRSSWEPDAIWGYMDCSPFGRGHQHEDKLNVLVSAYGENMLVEAGIFDYDDSETRRYVLSTRGHNTVRIDGMDQNEGSGYVWNDEDINKLAGFKFEVTPDKETAVSSFDKGYGAENLPVKHERKLIFFKNVKGLSPFFAVIDRLTAKDTDTHEYEAIWHLEECELTLSPSMASGAFAGGVGIQLVSSDKDVRITDMKGQYEPYYQGWFPIRPSGPHEHRRIPTPVFKGELSGERRVVTLLYPYKDGKDVIASVSASEAPAALDLTVTLKDGSIIELHE